MSVVREIPIDQVLREVAFTTSIVDEQVAVQVAGDVHPETVVHVCFGVELAHACVDEGHAGSTLAPFLPAGFVGFPFDKVEFEVLGEVERVVGDGDGHLSVEFAETDLADPGGDAGR